MRVIVTSSKSWRNEQAVIEALCELPASTTVLLPSNQGACQIVRDNSDSLKVDIEDWATEEDYDSKGGLLNAEMFDSDVDMCIAFLTPDAHAARDCVKRARNLDLDVRVVNP